VLDAVLRRGGACRGTRGPLLVRGRRGPEPRGARPHGAHHAGRGPEAPGRARGARVEPRDRAPAGRAHAHGRTARRPRASRHAARPRRAPRQVSGVRDAGPHDRRGGGRRRPARAPRGHPRYSRAHLAARGRPGLVNRREYLTDGLRPLGPPSEAGGSAPERERTPGGIARAKPARERRERDTLLAEETHMGVLDGIKILELARVPPAELPGMMLADMGADVLKIETPEPGRPADEDWVRRTIHTFTNRNKRSMTLNMKSAEGQEIFARLAAGADVI